MLRLYKQPLSNACIVNFSGLKSQIFITVEFILRRKPIPISLPERQNNSSVKNPVFTKLRYIQGIYFGTLCTLTKKNIFQLNNLCKNILLSKLKNRLVLPLTQLSRNSHATLTHFIPFSIKNRSRCKQQLYYFLQFFGNFFVLV